MLEKLAEASRTVGWKQTQRAIEDGTAKMIFLAEDTELHMYEEILACCKKASLQVVPVPAMKELGKACGIQVGAAVVAIVEEFSEEK